MKIKINWGHGIVIFFVIFLASIGYRVYISSKMNYDLVSSDYYPKEIEYQKQINKINNAAGFKDQIKVTQTKDSVQIEFPKTVGASIKKGTIQFYRPSDKNLDRSFELKMDTNSIRHLSKHDFVQGKYTLQIDWSDGAKEYFWEAEINF